MFRKFLDNGFSPFSFVHQCKGYSFTFDTFCLCNFLKVEGILRRKEDDPIFQKVDLFCDKGHPEVEDERSPWNEYVGWLVVKVAKRGEVEGAVMLAEAMDIPLLKSVIINDAVGVKQLLESGADANILDGAPLAVAAFNGSLEIAKCLPEHGAILDIFGGLPLRSAAEGAQVEMMKFLVRFLLSLRSMSHTSNRSY